MQFDEGSDLEFKVELEVLPEVPMPDFAGIEVERLKAEPSEEQVAKALEQIASRNRRLEDIAEERGAGRGEIAVCDFTGRLVGEDGQPGEPFPGGSATDMPIEVGGDGFIPGFTEQLDGIRAGETRTISVTFPEEYGAKELAGKAAQFEVTCKGAMPLTDDDAAKGVTAKVVAAMRFASTNPDGSTGKSAMAYAEFTKAGGQWSRAETKPLNPTTCAAL